MRKLIQGWTRMENPNSSAGLGPSLSLSPRTNHPRSSLHPSTPPSPPTRATCALQYACLNTPPPCPHTRLHLFCLPCVRAQDFTAPPFWSTSLATKACRRRRCHCHRRHCHRRLPNRRRAVFCAPVSLRKIFKPQTAPFRQT